MKSTPRSELLAVLDEERADAVIEFRKVTKKAPLTARGAKILANRFAEYGDANEAADIMIERCWQGFRAEWCDGPRRAETDLQRVTREMGQSNARTGTDHWGDSEVVPLFSGQRQGR